jgi:chaperonin GroES
LPETAHNNDNKLNNMKSDYAIDMEKKKVVPEFTHKIHLDRILLQIEEVADKTKAGVIISESMKKELELPRGIVVAVGPGLKEEPMTNKPGDEIMYMQGTGLPINIDGKKYLMIRQSNVLLTL